MTDVFAFSLSLHQRSSSLQYTRRRVKAAGKIGELPLDSTLIAEPNRFIDGWQNHRRITVVLIRRVNEVSKPPACDETLRSCKLAFNF